MKRQIRSKILTNSILNLDISNSTKSSTINIRNSKKNSAFGTTPLCSSNLKDNYSSKQNSIDH